jgi:hypothetical protein
MAGTSSRPRPAAAAAMGVALTLAAGLAIAWMDTRPHWDDTGVTAGVLVLASGLAALAGTRPWLAALLVAGPLVVAERQLLNSGMLLVLALALAGAYTGSLFRRRAASMTD